MRCTLASQTRYERNRESIKFEHVLEMLIMVVKGLSLPLNLSS